MPSPSGLLFILTPLLLVALGLLLLRRHPRDLLRLKLDWLALLWLAGVAAALRYTGPQWLPGWATARGGSVLLAVAWVAALAWVALNLRARNPRSEGNGRSGANERSGGDERGGGDERSGPDDRGGRGWPMRVALLVTAAGFSLNALAILANGGRMPFSVPAARVVRMPQAAIEGHAPLHVPLGPSHRLSWFADLIALPGLDKVVSVGDLLMIAGLAGVLLFGPDAAAARPVPPASRQGCPGSRLWRR